MMQLSGFMLANRYESPVGPYSVITFWNGFIAITIIVLVQPLNVQDKYS